MAVENLLSSSGKRAINRKRTAKAKSKRKPPPRRESDSVSQSVPDDVPVSAGELADDLDGPSVSPEVLLGTTAVRVQTRSMMDDTGGPTLRGRKKSTIFDNGEYVESAVEKFSLGDMDQVCGHCGALMFEAERNERNKEFQMCCQRGKVPLQFTKMNCPPGIKSLLSDPTHDDFKHFRQFIRQYNNSLSFVSTGVNLVDGINNGECSWIFKIHGQVCHKIYNGSRDVDQPQHNQVYFYDPQEAAALRKGMPHNKQLKESLLQFLDEQLRERNAFYLSHKALYEVEKEMLQNNREDEIENLCLIFRVTPGTDLRRWNAPTADEVSMVYQPGMDGSVNRDFAVYPRSLLKSGIGNGIRVQARSHYLEPMSYVLFYPHGGLGWSNGIEGQTGGLRNVSQREFYSAKLFERIGEFNPILYGGRLFQQYIVDMRMCLEQQKMDFIRQNQSKFLVESYLGLQDYLEQVTEDQGLEIGKTVICPSSVVGSVRWYREQYLDCMAMVQKLGRPDLFITITCNPDWPEIKNNLEAWQTSADRPDLVARVFMHRSEAILDDITKKHCLGKVKAFCYTVEFQKRGLPHIHMLVILEDGSKIKEPHQIDRIITAELPDPVTEPELYKFISTNGVHGPCNVKPEKRVCRQADMAKCSKHYPKAFNDETKLANQGYPLYRRRPNASARIFSKGKAVTVDNSWVVPYNKMLTQKHQCHINVEACVSIRSVKYVYKYIYKGGDRADVMIKGNKMEWDEVTQYLDGMYMTPPQAAWELFSGVKQFKSHVVKRLSVNLPEKFNVHFKRGKERQALEKASKKQSMLTAFFSLCQKDAFARTLLYEDVVQHYSFDNRAGVWKKHSDRNPYAKKYVARVYSVSPKDVEKYFMRLLLYHVRGPTCYEDLRSIDGVEFQTFRLAAVARGLVEDDAEWYRCLEEAAVYKMPKQMRSLFSYILDFNKPGNAEALWNAFKIDMSEDFMRMGYSEEDSFSLALLDIENFMKTFKGTLTDYGIEVPQFCPSRIVTGDVIDTVASETLVSTLNVEQRRAFDAITDAVLNGTEDRCFFIDGPGGSGKTYTYSAIQAFLAEKGKKVMATATTGIAADLLKDGRTMHNGFQIPLEVDESTVVTIEHESVAYKALRDTDLIIIDEASMMKAPQLNYVSEVLKYVTKDKRDFGGKVVVLGGDFRQTLPVIKGGSPSAILDSVVKRSTLWRQFKTYPLKSNMRAGEHGEFCDWLLEVGDGISPAANGDYPEYIRIPEKYRCEEDQLMKEIYGDALEVGDSSRLADRIVVAPTNKQAWQLNDEALAMIPAAEKVYYSIDSVAVDEGDINTYTPEFLNSLECSGMPFHKLVLKRGAVIMLLRNLQIRSGLQNGTRLLVLDLLPHLIRARILKGSKAGTIVFIPRIDCIGSDNRMPFQLRRRQFPVSLSFAMTINKAQGQSFERVGVFLPQTVFSHGQLYVALSRCRNPDSLFVKIAHEIPHCSLYGATLNVVWKSVLSKPSEIPNGGSQIQADEPMDVDVVDDSEMDVSR